MDTSLAPDKVELATISRDAASGKVREEDSEGGRERGTERGLCSPSPVLYMRCDGYVRVTRFATGMWGLGLVARRQVGSPPYLVPPSLRLAAHIPLPTRSHSCPAPVLPLPRLPLMLQVVYKIYDAPELTPLLDAANAEKEAAAQS